MSVDYFLRPMRADDVVAVERLTDAAYLDAEVRTRRAGSPEPEPRTERQSATWRERVAHLVRTDPHGCFVAEDGAGLLGVSISMKRELTWLLASFAVRPGMHGRGVGHQLLTACLEYGAGCLRSMLASSDDPLAVRRYRLAGFTLHPSMLLRGRVPRAALPVVERVRDGSAGDVDLMNSVDRQVRGSAHGPDHELLTRLYPVVVIDRPTGSGYAYVAPGGGNYLLAATNRRTATSLLWETLAASSPEEPAAISHVTAVNEWAVDVGMACRLELWTNGFLGVRGMRPPAPYLHSGQLL